MRVWIDKAAHEMPVRARVLEAAKLALPAEADSRTPPEGFETWAGTRWPALDEEQRYAELTWWRLLWPALAPRRRAQLLAAQADGLEHRAGAGLHAPAVELALGDAGAAVLRCVPTAVGLSVVESSDA